MTLVHRAANRSRAPSRTSPFSLLPFLVGGLALTVSPIQVDAQQPTPSQIQEALQQQPGLADMVRSRISQSGLTPDQLRARLSANGYPATLLDPYLSAS